MNKSFLKDIENMKDQAILTKSIFNGILMLECAELDVLKGLKSDKDIAVLYESVENEWKAKELHHIDKVLSRCKDLSIKLKNDYKAFSDKEEIWEKINLLDDAEVQDIKTISNVCDLDRLEKALNTEYKEYTTLIGKIKSGKIESDDLESVDNKCGKEASNAKDGMIHMNMKNMINRFNDRHKSLSKNIDMCEKKFEGSMNDIKEAITSMTVQMTPDIYKATHNIVIRLFDNIHEALFAIYRETHELYLQLKSNASRYIL